MGLVHGKHEVTDSMDRDQYWWTPQLRQLQAMACPAYEVFFGGAKGGGKSDELLGDYLQGVPEWGLAWKGIIFRRTYPELDEIIGRSKEIYGSIPGARYVGGDQRMWRIPSRSRAHPGEATLRFRSLESDQDISKYNGHQYAWIGFDELTEFPSAGPYEFMIKCNRSALGAPCFMRATGNPGRPGHAWVKARFIDIAEPGDIYWYAPNPKQPEKRLSRCFIPSKLEDNRILMQQDPDYESRLMTGPDHLVKALRYGEWDVVVGQVFSEFTREKHTVQIKKPLGDGWYRFASMDWGYSRPFSIGWWAVNDTGRVIRYREWYGCTGTPNEGLKMGARDVAAKAHAMGIMEGVSVMVADPACWSKSDDLPSVAESFAAAGFEMIKANNSRYNGLMKLHELMKTTLEDGKPALLISDTCRDWLRTVPLLTSDPRNPEDVNTEMEDHSYDDTRYAVMSEYVLNPRALRKPDRMTPRHRASKTYDPLRHGL